MAKRRSSYGYWWGYEPTRPLDVEDGIKAKNVRGKFVKNWWADRWIKALKRLMGSSRLSRGRSYARRGQVMEIDITPGHVASRVQGSRRTPYKVSIRLQPLSDQQWDKVLDALSDQAIFAAQLLNGEMPPDIEEVFDAVQVPLFPASRGDLQTDCSCPDWANPCKHIAAVYYLLGERLDEDPFLLFELRGRSKTEIAAALRERRAEEVETAEELSDMLPYVEEVKAPTLEECMDHYWMIGTDAEEMTFNITHPQVPLALLKRLGIPDFKGMNPRNFQKQMERAYDAVMMNAMQVAFTDSED